MFKLFMSLLIVCSFSDLTYARSKKQTIQKYTGIVKSCHDGDTCRIAVQDKIMKVRFSGIDAPEIKQPDGEMAKEYLEKQILSKNVTLECEGKSFDRTTCIVFLGSININQEMVKMGFAWDSPKYSKGRYRELMLSAQKQKLGIWKSNLVSPFCFRHKTSQKCAFNPLAME